MPENDYLCTRLPHVMVAQQVLVLFVVVRIRLGQRKKSDLNRGHSFCVVKDANLSNF